MTRRPLLHHELLLLSLHNRKGTHAHGQIINIGLAGGIFTELLLEDRIRIVEERGRRKPKAFVELLAHPRMHGGAMDSALERLGSAKRRLRPIQAVTRMGGAKNLRHQVATELCRMGILRESEDKVLLFFTRKIYPEIDPGPERDLIARIREAVEGGGTPSDRTAALVGLAEAGSLLGAIYSRKERKAYKKRIEELRTVGVGSQATRAAIEAAQAAVAAAVAAASAASAASG